MDRIREELKLVEGAFGKVSADDGLSWFIVERFNLPKGIYNRECTRVLHFIGPGYPQTPPDNFLVPAGLRTANGAIPGGGYTESQRHFDQAWGVFSWHAKMWHPTVNVADGDNLLTFLFTVQQRIGNGN